MKVKTALGTYLRRDMENINKEKDYSLYKKLFSFKTYSERHILNNIAKVNNQLRIHYIDELYELYKNFYRALYNKGNIRNKAINDMLVNISMLDMNFDSIYEFKYIDDKRYKSVVSLLLDIKNITYGWKNKINSEKEKQ